MNIKKIIVIATLLISTSVFAEYRKYLVMLGFDPQCSGGQIGNVVDAESAQMACNIALESYRNEKMYCCAITFY